MDNQEGLLKHDIGLPLSREEDQILCTQQINSNVETVCFIAELQKMSNSFNSVHSNRDPEVTRERSISNEMIEFQESFEEDSLQALSLLDLL